MAPAPNKSAQILEAAARELSDELTIALSCFDALLADTAHDDFRRENLYEGRMAVSRMNLIAFRLLVKARNDGAKPRAITLERLLEL